MFLITQDYSFYLFYFHVDYFKDILETYILIVNFFLEVRFFMIFIIVVVDKLCSRKSTLVYIIIYKYYISNYF